MDSIYSMLRQRGLPVTEMNFPMRWEDLDQDILATMPPKTRLLYRWDGSRAPYDGSLHYDAGDDEGSAPRTSRERSKQKQKRTRETEGIPPEAEWQEATWRPSW